MKHGGTHYKYEGEFVFCPFTLTMSKSPIFEYFRLDQALARGCQGVANKPPAFRHGVEDLCDRVDSTFAGWSLVHPPDPASLPLGMWVRACRGADETAKWLNVNSSAVRTGCFFLPILPFVLHVQCPCGCW